MWRIANFIDGAYLCHVAQNFGSPAVDFVSLARYLAQGSDILRSYYYDCLPYVSPDATTEAEARFARKERFIDAISHLPRFNVRLGQLEHRGSDEKGRPIYQQKRVDVFQGVDLAVLAAKHMITDAAIVAGDSDIIPAVEAAKAEGVVIHLFHGLGAHRDLLRICDERIYMNDDFFAAVRRVQRPPSARGELLVAGCGQAAS